MNRIVLLSLAVFLTNCGGGGGPQTRDEPKQVVTQPHIADTNPVREGEGVSTKDQGTGIHPETTIEKITPSDAEIAQNQNALSEDRIRALKNLEKQAKVTDIAWLANRALDTSDPIQSQAVHTLQQLVKREGIDAISRLVAILEIHNNNQNIPTIATEVFFKNYSAFHESVRLKMIEGFWPLSRRAQFQGTQLGTSAFRLLDNIEKVLNKETALTFLDSNQADGVRAYGAYLFRLRLRWMDSAVEERLLEMLERDSYWSVRLEAVNALADSKNPKLLPRLLSRKTQEKDQAVLDEIDLAIRNAVPAMVQDALASGLVDDERKRQLFFDVLQVAADNVIFEFRLRIREADKFSQEESHIFQILLSKIDNPNVEKVLWSVSAASATWRVALFSAFPPEKESNRDMLVKLIHAYWSGDDAQKHAASLFLDCVKDETKEMGIRLGCMDVLTTGIGQRKITFPSGATGVTNTKAGDEALAAFLDMLKDTKMDLVLRERMVAALGQLPASDNRVRGDVQNTLISLLEKAGNPIVLSAAQILQQNGSSGALHRMRRFLESLSETEIDMRTAVQSAMDTIAKRTKKDIERWKTEYAKESNEVIRSVDLDLLIGVDDVMVVPDLIAIFNKESSTSARKTIILGLRRICGSQPCPGVVEPLLDMAKDTDNNVRLYVLETLFKVLKYSKADFFDDYLSDSYPPIRIFACEILGEIGDSEVLNQLDTIRTKESEPEKVKTAAQSAAEKIRQRLQK